MIYDISSSIGNDGTTIGPITATRNMTIQITGEAGTITGAISVDGETFTDMDTYSFTGPTETFDIVVGTNGTVIQLTTTGTFSSATLIKED